MWEIRDKRTIRATVTAVYGSKFNAVIEAIDDVGLRYEFHDDTEKSGRMWWDRTVGSKIDFIVYDRPIETKPGVLQYTLATDDAIRVDDE